jgi:hypothetical protein
MQCNWKPHDQDTDGKINFYFNANSVRVFVELKKELRQYRLHELHVIAESYHPFMVLTAFSLH